MKQVKKGKHTHTDNKRTNSGPKAFKKLLILDSPSFLGEKETQALQRTSGKGKETRKHREKKAKTRTQGKRSYSEGILEKKK